MKFEGVMELSINQRRSFHDEENLQQFTDRFFAVPSSPQVALPDSGRNGLRFFRQLQPLVFQRFEFVVHHLEAFADVGNL